jgi:DNA-binding MarR family transcriptional regulator
MPEPRDRLECMTEVTADATQTEEVDFGQALAALLRRYLDGAREAVSDLPGGPRGYQVLLNSSGGTRAGISCSNQATIAQRLGIDRTVMTYLVDDLEKAGMVERRPDPADRRARQVVRTPVGEAELATASERIRAVEAAVLAGLSDDDAAVFRRLLAGAAADAPPIDHSACEPPAC